MSKRTVFTTLTPLPAGISRQTVTSTLWDHVEMIDLNPLVEERHIIKAPPKATAEEYHCVWYQLTDRVSYLPGGLYSAKVSYNACFHDLRDGLQTHVYAPLGLEIRNKWTLGGSLPGEAREAVELGLGAPLDGLWLREDVDMRCNVLMTAFVKRTLKKAHAALVDRLLVKASLLETELHNRRWTAQEGLPSPSPPLSSPGLSSAGLVPSPAFRSSMSAEDGLESHRGRTSPEAGPRLSNQQKAYRAAMPSPLPLYRTGDPAWGSAKHYTAYNPNSRESDPGTETRPPVELGTTSEPTEMP